MTVVVSSETDNETGVVAISSITLTDIFDSTPVQAFIQSDKQLTQTYNPADNTYDPDYTKSNLQLSLKVLRAGTTTFLNEGLTDVTWTYNIGNKSGIINSNNPADDMYTSGDKNVNLNITKNFSGIIGDIQINALVTYVDPATTSVSTINTNIKLSVLTLSKSSIIINGFSDTGMIFINHNPDKVRLHGDLYINGELTSIKRKNAWFRQDTSVTSVNNPLYDARVGMGWAKVDFNHTGTDLVDNFDIETQSQAQLSVFEEDVINVETYQLLVTPTETDHKGSTQKSFFTVYMYDSPIVVNIESADGLVYKNDKGSKALVARVYNSGGELDKNGTQYTYKWYSYREDGTLNTNFGGAGVSYKQGKSITVDHSEVGNSTSIVIEIE